MNIRKIKNHRVLTAVLQGLLLLIILSTMFSATVNLGLSAVYETRELMDSANLDQDQLKTPLPGDELLEKEASKAAPLKPVAAGMYASLSVLFLLMAFSTRFEWKRNLPRYGLGSLCFAGCTAAFLFAETESACLLAAVLHTAALTADHIFSIVRDHKARNIVFRAISILILLLCLAFSVLIRSYSLLMLLIATMPRIFYYIARIAFSQVKLDILRKIVRKTFAGEILFGMLLLIIAFSIVIPQVEPGIQNFQDALWYCFAIVTTIGFGDFSAVTVPGRIISVILGLYGIVVVALITSIIINFYSETKNSGDDEETDAP